MALTNYSELVAAVQQWMGDRTDLYGYVPDFITLCETEINHGDGSGPGLRVREMETSATVTLTSGTGTLPTDYLEWRQVRSLEATARDLKYITPSLALEMFPTSYAAPAVYFTITGSSLTAYPTPSTNVTLLYYAKVAALTESATTNWLMTKAPNVYLFGALKQAAIFEHDDGAGAMEETKGARFDRLFKSALAALTLSEQSARWARGASRASGITP